MAICTVPVHLGGHKKAKGYAVNPLPSSQPLCFCNHITSAVLLEQLILFFVELTQIYRIIPGRPDTRICKQDFLGSGMAFLSHIQQHQSTATCTQSGVKI